MEHSSNTRHGQTARDPYDFDRMSQIPYIPQDFKERVKSRLSELEREMCNLSDVNLYMQDLYLKLSFNQQAEESKIMVKHLMKLKDAQKFFHFLHEVLE